MLIPLRLSFILFLAIAPLQLNARSITNKSKITITAFNIRFYGLSSIATTTKNNESAHPEGKGEGRDPLLKKFLTNSIPKSDIFVFEEIVDVPRLSKLLPVGWSCISYDSPSPMHQHVVLCHSPKYTFEKEPSDDNYLIDEVAGEKRNLRPAVTVIVSNKNGKKLFRLVGVHLKASPGYSNLRVEQAKIISSYLQKLENSKLPVVITGDFNTYPATLNGGSEDDSGLILDTLNEKSLRIKQIPSDLFTFRNTNGQTGQFDLFYLSDSITVIKPLNVYSICHAETKEDELIYYNQNISDHCPVTAVIAL